MVDIAYTLKATIRRAAASAVPGKGEGAKLNAVPFIQAMGAAVTATSTVKMARIPMEARLSMASKLYWDDLASSGAPTLQVGISPVDSATANVANALNSGLDLATANPNGINLMLATNIGKAMWEILGLTANPGGVVDIYGTVTAAPTNLAGNLAGEIIYCID